MIELNSPFILLLLINSIITIILILNQNESTKDFTSSQNSNLSTNPLESITWVCLIIQLILVLIQTKLVLF
jgi:preprotein translocase subunit SecG